MHSLDYTLTNNLITHHEIFMQQLTAQFSIYYSQFLNEKGELTQPLPDFAQDPSVLVPLYEMMVLTRAFDSKATMLQRTGKLGTYPSSYGQEAISVAIGSAMQPTDVFAGYYREYGAHFQRGVKMEEILLYWGGDEQGSNFAECKEDFPHCVPIATQVLHATGIATAMKLRKQPRCAVTICGDGATSEGDFYEAINLAGVWKLPIVYLINNNQWAISVPLKLQTACQTLAQKGIAAGIPGEQVDGNDIIAVRAALDKALDRARRGEGPSLIEALTYRLGDHTTADDARRYRDENEVNSAKQKEPIKRLQKFLVAQNLWDEVKEKNLLTHCQQQVEKAVQAYENRPHSSVSEMFDYMYAQLPNELAEQREIALAYSKENK